MKKLILTATVLTVALAGCADMTTTQQRALSGTAIGAGGGAVIGAIAGNAALGAGIGAAAGLEFEPGLFAHLLRPPRGRPDELDADIGDTGDGADRCFDLAGHARGDRAGGGR